VRQKRQRTRSQSPLCRSLLKEKELTRATKALPKSSRYVTPLFPLFTSVIISNLLSFPTSLPSFPFHSSFRVPTTFSPFRTRALEPTAFDPWLSLPPSFPPSLPCAPLPLPSSLSWTHAKAFLLASSTPTPSSLSPSLTSGSSGNFWLWNVWG